MRKEIYETPEIIMDKFETEDIMEASANGHAVTGQHDYVTTGFAIPKPPGFL